ncbi:hypothetical protein FDK21_18670 [Cohaesibacter sp. CAU 1516]|uniref:hypothetical protein n=1 Tax=Cohaesibacter sp. CAU 1516 TaxID=2576038 RepID=UPI0010FD0370|nr:hypothetical protein [Cohaesibacter sp. CAU 1516]TLP43043.1 hypothetical protein FDK21_18670 [Cohaesibacter sp. CAU 1516]
MVQQSSDQQPNGDDPFQSPEMLELQRKMRRIALRSILVMVVGISSIIGILIYKSVTKKESASEAAAPVGAVTHSLNAGESIREMRIENGTVYLLVDGKGMTSVLEISKKNGSISRRIEFIPQAE